MSQQSKTRRKQKSPQRAQSMAQARMQTRELGAEEPRSGEFAAQQRGGASRSQQDEQRFQGRPQGQQGQQGGQRREQGGGEAFQLSKITDTVRKEVTADFDKAKQAMSRAGQAAMKTVRENPVPLALTGVGVAAAGAGITWFLMSKAKQAAEGASQGGEAREGNGGTARRLQSSVKEAAQTASKKATQLAEGAMSQGRKLEGSLEESVQAHPIAMGAALLAIGTAIGLSIPRTKIEDSWIGRERDQLVGAAQKVARGARQKVESVAKQIVGPVAQA